MKVLSGAWEGWRRHHRHAYRWARYAVPAGLLLLCVMAKGSGSIWTEWVQSKAFDFLQNARPRPYEATPVRIVDIDDESLSRLGQWPWPRDLLARLVGRLDSAGAAAIAFDVVFAEPDRTSPARLAQNLPADPSLASLRERLTALPDHDGVFARAVSKARVVMGFVLTGEANGVLPASKASFGFGGDGPLAYLDDLPGAVVNLPSLEKAAPGNGCFSFLSESDGIVRRVPLLFRRGSLLLPSLAAEALRLAQGASGYAVKSAGSSGEVGYGEHTGISRVKIGSFVVPTDAKGRVWVHFTRAAPERTIPAWRVLEKGFGEDGALEGSILFVGTSAPGLKDLRPTPLDPAAPGVEVHANLVEQILLGRFLKRPDWALGAEVLYMLVLGVVLLVLLPRFGAAWCALLAGGGVAGALWVSVHSFSSSGYLIDPIFPCLAILAVYVSSSSIGYLLSESERQQVKGAFSRYMSPALVDQLAKHPEKLALGGELREMTLLFCDIRGFTTISEQFDPHGLTRFINRFLTPMTEIILERKGTIDKYMGDCIMAFWNAPLDDPDHAGNAARSALEMMRRLEELNSSWKAEADAAGHKFIPVHIGVGLNTDRCCVGNMGSDQRFDYSVLGDGVNLASRLEGQSKNYGVDIVIGPGTKEKLPDFAVLELDLIRVKGKTVPVRIFTLHGGPEAASGEAFKALAARHAALLESYRAQRWDEAAAALEDCRRLEPRLRKLYDLYSDRLAAFRSSPPGPDWDGVFTATSK